MITGVRKVVVPADDEERAKSFWISGLGFRLTRDEPFGNGQQWIEVTPPDGDPVLILSRRQPGETKPRVPDELPHSPVFFNCDDIQATFRILSEHGVKFPAPPAWMPFGWWAMFEDPDGSRDALGQW
jgi:predicted enzyme related to lactoylglutathione lyase